MPAAVLEAFGAGATGGVVDDGLDDDAVARFVVFDAWTDFFDDAGEFVAEGEWDLEEVSVCHV